MKSLIKILLLAGYTFNAELLEAEISNTEFEFESKRVENKNEFIKIVKSYNPHVILADYELSQWSAIDALELLKEKNYNIPLILVTETKNEKAVVESLKLGIADYIIKGNIKRLPCAIINALKNKEFEEAKFEAEQALKAEFTFRKTIEESMRAGVTIFNKDFIQTYVNLSFCKMAGWSEDELIGKKPPFIYWASTNKEEMLDNLYTLSLTNKTSFEYETKFQKRNGELFDVQVLASVMKDPQGNITGWVEVIHDIKEQKQREAQINASLKEKEILLKEIHHRVKNNMQIISSMLSLQAGCLNDNRIQEVFNESRNRIKALALIHENLYKSKELTQIKFIDYIKDLVHNLFLTYRIGHNKIKFIQDIDDVYFDMDTSINLGIIINELVSNSIKHAFNTPKNTKNIIGIELKDENSKINLIISDNGSGLNNNIDFQNSESLGLQLVNTLVDQIEGTLEVKNNNGTKILIQFNYSIPEDRLSNTVYSTNYLI